MSTFRTKVTFNGETHKCNLPSDFEQARILITKTFGRLLPTLWVLSYEENGTHEVRSNQDYNKLFSLQPKRLTIVEDLDQTLYTEQEIPNQRQTSLGISSENEDEEKASIESAALKKKQDDSSSESEDDDEEEEEEEEEKPKHHKGSFKAEDFGGLMRTKPILEPPASIFKKTQESFQMREFGLTKEKPAAEKKKKKRGEPEVETAGSNLVLQMNPNLMEQIQAFQGDSKNYYSEKGKAKEVRKAALKDLANESSEGHNMLAQMMRELMMQSAAQTELVLKRLEKVESRLEKEKKSKKEMEEKVEKLGGDVLNIRDVVLQSCLKTEKKFEELGQGLEGLTKEVQGLLAEMKPAKTEALETTVIEKKQDKDRGEKSMPKKGKKEEPKKKAAKKQSSSESDEEESTSSSESSSESPKKKKNKVERGRKPTEVFGSSHFQMGGFQNLQSTQNQRFDQMNARMVRGQWANQHERNDRSPERIDPNFGRQAANFGYQQQPQPQPQPQPQNYQFQNYPPQQQQQQQYHQQQQQQGFPNEQLAPWVMQELEEKYLGLMTLFPKVDREAFRRVVYENPKMSLDAIIQQYELGKEA